jgi:hypothetical protein
MCRWRPKCSKRHTASTLPEKKKKKKSGSVLALCCFKMADNRAETPRRAVGTANMTDNRSETSRRAVGTAIMADNRSESSRRAVVTANLADQSQWNAAQGGWDSKPEQQNNNAAFHCDVQPELLSEPPCAAFHREYQPFYAFSEGFPHAMVPKCTAIEIRRFGPGQPSVPP